MDISNQYEIEFTEEARKEIKKIYKYIKNELYAENAAKRIMNKVENLVKNLRYSPKIYAKIDKYEEIKMVYRRIIIDNYVLLYTINEENKTIYIMHMYYGGSDYINKI